MNNSGGHMSVQNDSKRLLWKIFAVCLIAIFWPPLVQADLQIDINRELLRKSSADKSRSNYEKLFVYRCETIANTIGFSDTASGRATKYSCDEPGVGIAFYAGPDLGKHSPEKVGKHFKDELAKHGMISEVFIQDNGEYGSSMGFYINGESWLPQPIDPLEATEKIKFIAAEAKLILLTDGRIKELPRAVDLKPQ